MRVDFHSHILPDMDDGCKDLKDSLKQVKLAEEYKINFIAATSHFYPHVETVESFLSRREKSFRLLKGSLSREAPEILLGAEVLLYPGMDKMPDIELLCLEGTKVLLLEMPFFKEWDLSYIKSAIGIRDKKDLIVVLAHGERYRPKEIKKLTDEGFLMQINTNSMKNIGLCRRVRDYVKNEYVTAFGSDLHKIDNSYKRYDSVMKKFGKEAVSIQQKAFQLIKPQAGQGAFSGRRSNGRNEGVGTK